MSETKIEETIPNAATLAWVTKPLLTEKDGALKCHFCGRLVHIPGMKAHMDCAINAYVDSLRPQK